MSNCFVRLFCIPALFTIFISSSLLTPDVSFGADNYAAPQTAEVTLAWDPNDPASDGYRLYQRKEGEVYDYNQPCWTGAVTTGTVYNLDWDSTYYFVVRAYEGTFESADSGEVSYVTPSADLTTYSISATAGDHGAISPIGEVDVTNSSDQVFTITPDPGYQVADVQVDGVSVGAINSYTFNNVVAVHTITTSFKMNNNPDDGRITSGLLSLYNFTESQGVVVHDVSGTGIPMDLMIGDLGSVNWINGGGIRIMSPTLIRSVGSAVKLTDAITASGELTIEAWVKPDNTNQGGPARIVTLSQDAYYRNFTLGQEKGSFDVRLRTSDTSTNGMPSLRADNEVRTQLTHVLYTRDAQGVANLYINGNIVLTKMVTGGLTNWDDFAFAIGNELTGDRPWLGELYLVSIYDRSLTGQEVVQNYLAGHASNSDDPNQPQTHSITATSNGNGNVFPSGVFNIEDGASQEITISPENGYQIHDVLVDNQSIGPLNSYLFDSVSGDHSLHAIFLPTSYTISASAGAYGSINPIGTVVVNHGEGQTYTITPNTDCQITDVLVDGVSLGAVSTYTFDNVAADHTITANFAFGAYAITASAGSNGSILPAGTVNVEPGASKTYAITPNAGYHVADVQVDGMSIGAAASYTFSQVSTSHRIYATFAAETYTLTATAGENGSISPVGSMELTAGGSQTFNFFPDSGFHIDDVQVDGQSMAALNQYTFSNLNNNHTIGVIFSESNHVNIWIEAEDGDLQYPMEIADDDSAGAGGFIWVPSGTGNLYSPSDSAGYAEYHFEVPEAGDYVVWGHQISNDSSSDSFFVSVDGGSEIAWHTKPGGQDVWTWDVVSLRSAGDPRDSSEPERFSFAAGPHTLKIKQREDGTKLDKILITNQTDLIEPEPEPEPEPDAEVTSMEFGQVELDHHWTRIDLEKEFAAPVVVTGPASLNGDHPAVVRIRNVDSSGFEVRIQEWDYLDGSHPTETVSYLVMEKGSHTLGDGTKIEVATLESSAAGSFHDIVFNQQFNVAPVVMSTISTYNDPTAVTGRIKNITTDGFEYRMQEQELNVQDHAPETIGYIAWEPSSGALGDVTFLIDQTANAVKHKSFNIDFQTPFAASPAFLAGMQTTDGGDTANVRYSSKTGVSVDVLIDEEESKNTETNHTSEVVGFMAFMR